MAFPLIPIMAGASALDGLFSRRKKEIAAYNAAKLTNISTYFTQKNTYDNSLAALKINEANRGLGYSRTMGQIEFAKKAAAGKSFRDIEALTRQRLAKQTVNEGGRARGYGRSKSVELLAKQAAIESKLRHADLKGSIQELGALRQWQDAKKYPGAIPQFKEPKQPDLSIQFGDLLTGVTQGLSTYAGGSDLMGSFKGLSWLKGGLG